MKSYVFPGDIEEDIRRIAAEPIPYMRTPEFSRIVLDNERMLLELIHCTGGRVIPFTASGTAAMDAVVSAFVAAPCSRRAFVINGGSFGRRWKDLCEYYGCEGTVVFDVPFARDIDYDALDRAVSEARPDIFLCQHHETSTGQLFNLEKISDICRRYGVILAVDVISTFLAEPLDMDALGIDIALTSSQKGLNIAPGLSLLFLSERCLKEITHGNNNFYLDIDENLRNLTRGQTPFSPVTTIFLQLHERLRRIEKIGADAVIATVRERALYFRSLCRRYGWEVPAEVPSNAITGFFVRRNSDRIFAGLIERGFYIMPGGTPGYFRVSHMGLQTHEELDALAAAIREIETS